jgi:C-terminal processing protease CtpA/Prc
MKLYHRIFLLVVIAFGITSCFSDNDDVYASDGVIKNFIYRGMNTFYLYKPEIPELANDRFASVSELEEYHSTFPTTNSFFESLIFDRSSTDRFSILVDDYVELEQLLQGVSATTGMEFGLVAQDGSATDIFGYVRYVLPNTPAENQGVTRGMIFNQIDGQQLTRSNFRELLAPNTYTIGLANLNGGVATYNGTDITLTKQGVEENPIFITNVIDQGPHKIGYLMYNGFTSNFDQELNAAFGDFVAQGITHLVLDLRYNGGGSVNTAIILGSLISGRPTSDVFSREEWNPDIQQLLETNNPSQLINNFKDRLNGGTMLNELGLNKVHIITSGASASASELVIAALDPYMDVVQVGTTTAGKFQASITLYDSSDYSRNDVNPSHRYAIQPLVLKSVNSVGFTDYINGIDPDITLSEDFENLGVLGDVSEPLLARCLADIQANGRPAVQAQPLDYKEISSSKSLTPFANEMYIDHNRLTPKIIEILKHSK